MRESKYEKLKVLGMLYIVVVVILAVMFSTSGAFIHGALTLGALVALMLWYPAILLQRRFT